VTAADDDALDAVLDRLEELDAEGDEDALRATLESALTRFPRAPALREWRVCLAVDDEELDEAIEILDGLLDEDPDNAWARRERAAVLIDLGRFDAALADLQALPRPARRQPGAAEQASIHADVGLCLDRLGRTTEADAEFRQAARLDADAFAAPLRLSTERFEALVGEALDAVPPRFRPYLEQVVTVIRDYPDADDPDPFLLGLYVGVPRSERTLATADHLDHVVVFKRSHELRCRNESELRDEVGRTVVHELAHHFGIDDDDMDEEYR
jgi:predicted Zn-dependent protease with MMP-like domain